jgi:anaerobic selenocysteine-containing dehydrogenase
MKPGGARHIVSKPLGRGRKYPLQPWSYAASALTHDNNDWLEEARSVPINPIDAAARGIADGDFVKVLTIAARRFCLPFDQVSCPVWIRRWAGVAGHRSIGGL